MQVNQNEKDIVLKDLLKSEDGLRKALIIGCGLCFLQQVRISATFFFFFVNKIFFLLLLLLLNNYYPMLKNTNNFFIIINSFTTYRLQDSLRFFTTHRPFLKWRDTVQKSSKMV